MRETVIFFILKGEIRNVLDNLQLQIIPQKGDIVIIKDKDYRVTEIFHEYAFRRISIQVIDR